MTRVGIGVDIHQFADHRKLIIGGVTIPCDRGLAGHSDADVLAHAVADALLGAIGLGDIGSFYPDTDMKYKDIDSMLILRDVTNQVKEFRGRIVNIDTTLIAQIPKLAPYISNMKQTMSKNLMIESSQIGVKATTSEWMGFTGRKEGIVALAIASVEID